MQSSLIVQSSFHYFCEHQPAATNPVPLTIPHIYSTFPIGGGFGIQSGVWWWSFLQK